MEKKDQILTIPFVAHESAMNRMERTNKRLVILNIIELAVIILMFASIMIYFYLPTEVIEDTQTVSDIQDSEVNQNIGD